MVIIVTPCTFPKKVNGVQSCTKRQPNQNTVVSKIEKKIEDEKKREMEKFK